MNYLPVRLKTLKPNVAVTFDVYIKVGAKYVHYISNQDHFDDQRVQKLKSKGVKKLFIPVDSEDAYLDYLDQGLKDLTDSSISTDAKGGMVNDTLTTTAENSERIIENHVKFTKTSEKVNKIVDFLANESGALKSILSSAQIDSDNAQHCAAVTSLSLGLAMKLGINDKQQLMELGLGALLHDIGLKKLEGIDINMPADKLEAEALKQYKEHPRLGMEMLSDKPFVTQGIKEIVYNHEEKGEGEGFPEKKSLKSLPVLCQILNICNEYDRFCRTSELDHQSASSQFFVDKMGLFELNYITNLKKLIKESQ